jgi:hypothetical protein
MKYSDLVDAWRKSTKEWQDYEFACAAMAANVYRTLRKTFGLEDDKLFKLVDPEEQNEEKIQSTLYAPMGATKLADMGWAKFGLYLVLQVSDNAWPKRALRFTSFVKIDKDSIRLRATQDDEELRLNTNLGAADEEKIVDKYERLIRLSVQDSFSIWHEAD